MISVSPTRQPKRIKAQFIVPLSIALALIMTVFAITIYGVEAHIRDRDLAERSAAVARMFALQVEKDVNLMMATMHALMSNQKIEKAFWQGNRRELSKLGAPLFEALRGEHRITHMYFTRPDLVVLNRFHSPEEYGDTVSRFTTLQANQLQKAVHGIELGTMGTLTLRLVTPWKVEGNLLGFIELGEEVEYLVDEISRSLSVDLFILMDKSYLSHKQWERGQLMMDRKGEWSNFETHVVLAQTTRKLPIELDDKLLGELLSGGTAEIHEQQRSLHLAVLPIEDASHRHVADMIVMRDITDLEATFQWSTIAVLLLSLLAAGSVVGVFYLALDRVERDYQRQHDLEHQLLHLDTEHRRILQMEKLSALGTMVGGIAHQLNNPLVGVVNMAQLAERELDEQGDPSRMRELLAEIRRAGSDCRAFVRRMLEFSKVSCFESKPTALVDLIDDTVLMFRQTEARHLPVEVELPNAPPELIIDPILVRHALFNLLQNAAQATAGNATITIRLEAQTDPSSGAPAWRLSVSDRGRGIAPEAMERIFVPFFTTRSDGTGLGLPVVQQVALLHNGHVTAANRPEGGAEFAIWLPQ